MLRSHVRLVDGLAGRSLPRVVVVKVRSHHGASVQAHRLRFVQDALERVDQVVVILVRLEDVEARQDELILLLDQLVQKLDVVRVAEMEPSQRVHILQKLIFLSWQWRLWPLQIG